MSTIPPGQGFVLTCYADAEDEGRQASRAEVAELCGYAFPSAVSKHVDALVRKGYLINEAEKKRNVRLTDAGWAVLGRTPANRGVPIIGHIAAGAPILAQEHQAGFLQDVTARNGRIALKIRGDSMIEAGINDGDYAIIDTTQPVASGSIGAVIVEDEATLKVVRKKGSDLILEPRNKKLKPLVLSGKKNSGTEVRIVGPLLFTVRQDFN
ncbi:MAG: hypothetical protein EA401_05865 [Planctomycetota bacterium]|nr:MAG: hypothetical protein EA401_05865 [Planctomycetota bacterium]